MKDELTETWSRLLASVKAHRNRDARYFKPTCLFAVCSLVDKGANPAVPIPVERVICEFDTLVEPVFPLKAGSGWMPLWHLTNDQAWTCTKMGVTVPAEVFRTGRPKTMAQLENAVDSIELSRSTIALWLKKDSRDVLKFELCMMMKSDTDEATRRMGTYLDARFSPAPQYLENNEFI